MEVLHSNDYHMILTYSPVITDTSEADLKLCMLKAVRQRIVGVDGSKVGEVELDHYSLRHVILCVQMT